MAAPAIVLRLELERRPVACVVADHDEDEARIKDWVAAHPAWQAALAELLDIERAA